jgi:ABC-type nitrate/sulfonate/bicarbonate transport system permease component
VVSIIAAELIAATTGLGYLIMQAEDYLNTALVFSGIITIAFWGSSWTPTCAGCSC